MPMAAEILLSIALLLLSAKVFGEITERLGAASLVGQLLAGIVVGPILGLVVMTDFMNGFLTLGIIMLLFMAGLEIKFNEIKKYLYSASVLAFTGGIMSFMFGFLVGMVFFNDTIVAFAIGTVLISTSNGTLFLFLMKSGEFSSKTGKMIIAVTIADDVVGMLFLSFFSVFIKSHTVQFSSTLQLLMLSIGLYLVVLTVGSKIADRFLNAVSRFLDREILLVASVAVAFFVAYATENLQLSFAVGAFLAGMAIANSKFNEPVITPKVRLISEGFFIPIFYAAIGASIVFAGINPLLIAAIVAAAVLGKIIGIGVFSGLFGIKGESRKLMSFIMIPRGNENIAVVQIVLLLGAITFETYTSIIFAMMITVLLTPILLKIVCKKY